MLDQLDEFGVTRMLGMNALTLLSHAHEQWEQKEYWKKKRAEQTPQEMFQTADEPGVHVRGYKMAMRSSLSAVVIQYQASMEAILSNAAAQSTDVASVATSGGFGKDWRAALQVVGESRKEFNAYHDHFYQELRIPLTHLHGKTREVTEDRLRKINAMDFPEVYNGVRYGWWAHIRLMGGIGLGTGPSIQENWEYICQGANVQPDLFPDAHPDNLPET